MTKKELILYGFVVIFLLVGLFSNLNILELRGEEPRRAVVSMEMVLSGQYIVPKINDWPYYNKPPLFNWIMAMFFKIFQCFDEWVVRLPSLLSFCLIGVINYFVTKKYIGLKAALLGSLFFITAADILFYGTIFSGELDLFYTLIVYLQIVTVIHFSIQRKYLLLFLISYFLTALGVLCKGLPSIAFQVLTLLGIFLYGRKFIILFSWKHFAGIIIFLVIICGYLITYSQFNDVSGLLLRQLSESVERSVIEVRFIDHMLGILTYPFLFLKLIAPWSVFIIFMFNKEILNRLKSNPYIMYSVIFILINIPVYWFSNYQKSRYVYMFFPFIMNVISWLYITFEHNKTWKHKILDVFFMVCFILFAVFIGTIPFLKDTSSIPHISVICLFLFTGNAILFYMYLSDRQNRVIYIILFMTLLKIGQSYVYIPFFHGKSDKLVYRNHVSNIIRITGENPVYLTGEPYSLGPINDIGIIQITDTEIKTAPLIAYQIPYYIMKENHQVMEFHPVPRKGYYYISTIELSPEKKVLYTLWDDWMKRDLFLYLE